MKKLIVTFFITLFLTSLSKGQFTNIGGGISSGTGIFWNNESDKNFKTGNIAINFNGVYQVKEAVQILPSITWFIPKVNRTKDDLGAPVKRTISSSLFDINGQYIFNPDSKFELYCLSGFNVTFIGNKTVTDLENSNTYKLKESDNTIGLNLGAGTCIKFNEWLDICCEAKYIISKYDQLVINVGVLFNFQKDEQEY